jgi:selenocysteine lyase/cysteine desulfurase
MIELMPEVPMAIDRREMLGMAALPLAMQAAPGLASLPAGSGNEAYWNGIAALYDRPADVIQLESGNWVAMARPVLEAYRQHIARVNRDTSYYARRGMNADLRAVHQRLAIQLGCAEDEIVFTRNATEALKAVIGGYNRLQPGDAVLHADLDYDSTRTAFASLARRHSAELIDIAIPEPATWQGVIDAYAAAFDAHPRIRLILLTHVSHRTGLILPVREIVALARARGIDAIVDAAHSIGQLDYRLPDLDADFVGFNLHKWIGAPLGVGLLYVRRERLSAIDPDPAELAETTGAAARVHTGTVDYAALLSVSDALDFGRSVGASAREARLRALRDRWVLATRDIDGLEILTPPDPRLHCAITSFRLRGRPSVAGNVEAAKLLLDRHGIFTVHRTGVARGACVRVTPALVNRMADVDRFAEALRDVVATLGGTPSA